jgi:hypothetical protein
MTRFAEATRRELMAAWVGTVRARFARFDQPIHRRQLRPEEQADRDAVGLRGNPSEIPCETASPAPVRP